METVYDINKIMEMLPHRSPFLLVDRVIELHDPGDPTRVGIKAVGIKCVTFNEPFFPGHFPGLPIMPAVLQVEAMAQLAALSFFRKGDPNKIFMIASIQHAKFRKPVVPGDQLVMTSEVVKVRGSMIVVKVISEVEGERVNEVEILAHVSSKKDGSQV